MNTENKLPEGFASPTALPENSKDTDWQEKNQAWWENNPMRYDWNEGIPAGAFSRAFYEEIDKRFFNDAARYMPPKESPFDEILPFHELPELDVLEIGVGNGSHAQLIAPHSRTYTGVDLTDYAVKSTITRFELFHIEGKILPMDAEEMAFPNESFDLIWTWGVIHHSANTGRILSEMYRVLRPGGRAVVMVYHRSFLYYYITTALIRGILAGGFFRGKSLHDLVQLHTDGAIARFYRPWEWQSLISKHGFHLIDQRIKGQKSEIFPIPASKLKGRLMDITPNCISRFILNTCRQGSFLITTIQKPGIGN